MIVKPYIKTFENYGLGLFVHFGIYSVLAKGEWAHNQLHIPDEEYSRLREHFNPAPDWAEQLAQAAKEAGCRYITLTTRHHDGFSLFDTQGLNDYDAPHTCGRDLVREFVDACRRHDIVPFFYHTLLDWHDKRYREDFPAYLQYLRDSVSLLCRNYGKIGGLWFDGMWDKPEENWEEDALYSTIRRDQPEAMIINNTGLFHRGELGHIELDSVTFERGKPEPINMEDSPKYIASEMCETLNDHWGFAAADCNYKSPAEIIREIGDCRRYGANMLLNIGPRADGTLRPIDRAYLGLIGEWVATCDEALRSPRPTGIEVKEKPDNFILRNGNTYYLFCYNLPMVGDSNVAITSEHPERFRCEFELDATVRSATWMDNGNALTVEQNGKSVTVLTPPFTYGSSGVVRVAKIETE